MSGNDEWWDNYLQEQRDNRIAEVQREDERAKLQQEKDRQSYGLASTRDNLTNSAVSGPSGKGAGSSVLGSVIGCMILVVALFVAIYLFGWAIDAFIVK